MDNENLNITNEENAIEEIKIDAVVADENLPENTEATDDIPVTVENDINEDTAPADESPVNKDFATDTLVYPSNSPAENKTKKIFAIVSMITGIASLIFSCCSFLSIPCGIAAIVFGVLGLNSKHRAMAIAGIVIGSISMVISLILTITVVAAFVSEVSGDIYPSSSSSLPYSNPYLW